MNYFQHLKYFRGALGCIVLGVALRAVTEAHYLRESFLTVALVICIVNICKILPLLENVFSHLGKYSKYMWLIHGFIIGQWFKQEFLSLYNIWMIWIAAIGASFVAALFLYGARKAIDYVIQRASKAI